MSHHLLQHGQADAGASHVGAEGMAEAMGMDRGEQSEVTAPLAKEAANTGGRHGRPATRALQNHEEPVMRAAREALELEILGESPWVKAVEQHGSHFRAARPRRARPARDGPSL
jgi:hypothetical protein